MMLLKCFIQYDKNLENSSGHRTGKGQTLFLGAPRSLQMVTAAMKLKDTCALEEKL